MNAVHFLSRTLLVTVACLLVGACTSQMEPARQAIAGIEGAIDAASSEASKYIPEQYAAAQGKLAELRAAFDRKEYRSVVTSAPGLLAEAQGLAAAAAAKKDEVMKAMTAEWSGLSTTVPALVAAVDERLAALARDRRLPEGIDLEGARNMLGEARQMWTQAQAASANSMEDAVMSARKVREKTEAAAAALKLALPAAAPAG